MSCGWVKYHLTLNYLDVMWMSEVPGVNQRLVRWVRALQYYTPSRLRPSKYFYCVSRIHRIENKTEGRLSIDHSKELYICCSGLFVYVRLPYTYTVDLLNIPHKININPHNLFKTLKRIIFMQLIPFFVIICYIMFRNWRSFIYLSLNAGRDMYTMIPNRKVSWFSGIRRSVYSVVASQ